MGLGGIIAGAIGGFGAAAEDVGTRQLIEIAMQERDSRLAEMRKSEQERGFAHAEKQTERQIEATHIEGEAGRSVTREGHSLQRDLAAEQRTLTREEGRDTRQTQKDIAETHERAAGARHGQSMAMQKLQLDQALKIADMSRPLQQDAEGHYFKMGTKGPEYITDASGQKFKGPKDLTARETKAADAILAQMKATAMDSGMDPNSRDVAMRAYQQSLSTLLFGGKTTAPAAPGGERPPLSSFGAPAKAPTAQSATPSARSVSTPSATDPDLKNIRIGPLTPITMIHDAAKAGNQAAIDWVERKRIEEDERIQREGR